MKTREKGGRVKLEERDEEGLERRSMGQRT